jgi:hypothetical protein
VVTRSDIVLAQRAYHQGDLGPAEALILGEPEALGLLLDERELLGGASWETTSRRQLVLAALRETTPSAALLEVLLPLGLGTRREEREVAQTVIARAGTLPTARLFRAIASGTKDERVHAADWLARARVVEAVPLLVRAFEKEKVEAARASILRALVGLGEPLARFLDRDRLAADAEKVLAKGWPASLAFLGVETLPRVRWKDGAEVAPNVVRAWLLAAHKAKTPMASPLLVAYAHELEEATREALGEAIHDRWLEEDFRLPEPLDGDVRERLEDWAQKAGMSLEAYARTPGFKLNVGSLGWMIGKSVETGALEHRGVLAVAAALAPRRLVPRLVRYVREFRGLRIGASRAMLHMLAGMDDRAATQELVRLSMRFRTASLRKEAEKLVREIAALRGWSPEELADHTIPTAGLDEDGVLHLAFVEARGEPADAVREADADERTAVTRRFEARLDDHLELVLFALGPDGSKSVIAKLPEPRKDEDPAFADLEKKRLSVAKKELKALVVAQRERLFASMCSERAMAIADFRALYVAHPIMRRLLTRVVLLVRDGARHDAGVCRVSEDGSLVTSDNETLVPPEDAHVVVAHGSLLGPVLEARVAEHLAEYHLAPLFPQLGRTLHQLDPEQPGLLRLVPPSGPERTVSGFALRGRMKRLGWERGPSGDGGFVDRYVRPFVALGLEAVLVHTPVPQPESDVPVSIEGIEVHRLPPAGAPLHAPRSVLFTRAVPSVLRHELWNDLLDAYGR